VNLPGSAKTHLYVGLIVAFVGIVVGGYAYTGDRIYDIVYLPVALFGLALLLAGSALAGYGQANRPRLGGRGQDEEPSIFGKLALWITDRARGDDAETEAEADDVDEPAASS
jgi:hypothetical protein